MSNDDLMKGLEESIAATKAISSKTPTGCLVRILCGPYKGVKGQVGLVNSHNVFVVAPGLAEGHGCGTPFLPEMVERIDD